MKKILSFATIALILLMLFPIISSANSSYTEWTDVASLPTKSGSYKLANDVIITKSITIPNNVTVTLDLNGHTVKVNGSSAYYFIQTKGTLIIEDSKGNGKMTNDGSSSTSGNVIYVKGNCQINGGTIENTISSGTALFINNGDSGKATCTLNDGTIVNSYTKSGRAVKVNQKATFIMNGGKVENKAAGSDGLVPAIEGHKVIVIGGTIESAGTAIQATGESVEITGGTINAGFFGLHTRYTTINPAEDKTVKITAGRAAIIAYSVPTSGKANKIYGGTFDAPTLMESKYVCDSTNLEIYGGRFDYDITEYVAPGYIVNKVNDLYEVKLNKPSVSQDTINSDDGKTEMGIASENETELQKIFEEEFDKNETLKNALLDGKTVNIEVQMKKLEEKDINEEELKAIKEASKEEKIVKFYDITLAMMENEEKIDTIKEVSSKLKFKVLIPEELLKEGRVFFMYRYHEGENSKEVNKITGELDEENYFIFESDRFSTYALAYLDEEDKTEQPPVEEPKVEEPKAEEPKAEERKAEEPKTEEVQQTVENKKDETPKTGVYNIALYVLGLIALISAVGIVKSEKIGKYSK